MALSYVQAPTTYLSGSGVTIGATTVSVTTFTDIYGNVLTMSSFGAKGYATLEPDTSNEEAFTFTSITPNANGTYTLGGVSSALAQTPYTEASGLVRSHAGGTKLVITDSAAFWNTFANKANNETITGTWTFNNAPVALSATPASTSVLGNVKLTTAPFTILGTATITIASPAVISFTAHGLIAGDSVQFTTTGTLPTGLSISTNYFVIATGLTANAFEVSTTVGGSAVNTTGSQSGVQTLVRTTPFAVGNEDPRLVSSAISGEIKAVAFTTVPTGYLACDGTAVSRSTNASLFTAIGTTWGAGDGSTTFNVPDFRSRSLIGRGTGVKIATFSSRASNVLTVTGLTNASNNEFQTGQAVLYTTTGTDIGGLSGGSTYYIVRVTNTTFSLATSQANAQAGTLITLTSDGTGTRLFTLGLSARTLADTGGVENLAEVIAHFHSLSTFNSNKVLSGSGSNTSTYGGSDTTGTTGVNSQVTTMSPFAAVNYIIKT